MIIVVLRQHNGAAGCAVTSQLHCPQVDPELRIKSVYSFVCTFSFSVGSLFFGEFLVFSTLCKIALGVTECVNGGVVAQWLRY